MNTLNENYKRVWFEVGERRVHFAKDREYPQKTVTLFTQGEYTNSDVYRALNDLQVVGIELNQTEKTVINIDAKNVDHYIACVFYYAVRTLVSTALRVSISGEETTKTVAIAVNGRVVDTFNNEFEMGEHL